MPQIEARTESHAGRLDQTCDLSINFWSEMCMARQNDRPVTQKLQAEFLAEIDAAHILMRYHRLRLALHQNLAVVENIGPIDDLQRFPHVMVGDQHAEAAML